MTEHSNNLDKIPAIAPGKDALAARRRGKVEAPRQSNFNGVLVFSLVLMAIMLGVGGFTLFEVQQRLDQSNELLEQANRGVRDLQDRLAATGTDVSKEIQTVKETQAMHFEEIDKLWKVAYRENRPALKEVQSSLAALKANSEKQSQGLEAMNSDMAKFSVEFMMLSRNMTQVRQNLVDDSAELNTQVALLRNQVQDQRVVLEGNRRSLAVQGEKLKTVEDAIVVFDRYRQQVNQQLVELSRQVQTIAPAQNGVN